MVAQLFVASGHDLEQVLKLRHETYKGAGKFAKSGCYDSPLDSESRIYLILLGGKPVGTFAIFEGNKPWPTSRIGINPLNAVRMHLGLGNGDAFKSMYVHSLGLSVEARSAEVLKLVFGEVFKYLVHRRLEYVVISADKNLSRKYRWIGFNRTDTRLLSPYEGSGHVTVMYTRQTRRGIYGLHADPIRWNIFLRTPIRELLSTRSLPHHRVSTTVYWLYSILSTPAAWFERASRPFLRSKPSPSTFESRRLSRVPQI